MDVSPTDDCVDIISRTEGSQFFDDAIGHIEDIVLGDDFQVLHDNFLEKYWQCFENSEENKLEYMDIFQKYTDTFEKFLMEQLCKRMPDFDMKRFVGELEQNTKFDDVLVTGEIYELLYSFTNFQTFKELMLDYRNTKEGNIERLTSRILVTMPYLIPESAVMAMSTVQDEANAI